MGRVFRSAAVDDHGERGRVKVGCWLLRPVQPALEPRGCARTFDVLELASNVVGIGALGLLGDHAAAGGEDDEAAASFGAPAADGGRNRTAPPTHRSRKRMPRRMMKSGTRLAARHGEAGRVGVTPRGKAMPRRADGLWTTAVTNPQPAASGGAAAPSPRAAPRHRRGARRGQRSSRMGGDAVLRKPTTGTVNNKAAWLSRWSCPSRSLNTCKTRRTWAGSRKAKHIPQRGTGSEWRSRKFCAADSSAARGIASSPAAAQMLRHIIVVRTPR